MSELLVVRDLVKRFRRGRRVADTVAVGSVSFDLAAGSTLAVVGESGAGKSTLGRLVLRLIEADAGSVVFDGVDVRALRPSGLRRLRRDMQMIFQDPYNSFDPRYTIGRAVAEPLRIHFGLERSEQEVIAEQKLAMVGLSADHLERKPHELSGGELQRAAIARALVVEPKLIVCDEPVAALDVSIAAQVLNLLVDIQAESNVSYLFITHNLSTVKFIATDVMVMLHGRVVEVGPADQVLTNPTADYTRTLLDAVPSIPHFDPP